MSMPDRNTDYNLHLLMIAAGGEALNLPPEQGQSVRSWLKLRPRRKGGGGGECEREREVHPLVRWCIACRSLRLLRRGRPRLQLVAGNESVVALTPTRRASNASPFLTNSASRQARALMDFQFWL